MEKRVLGLDVGTKTIGVAVSDPLGLTAQSLGTIRRRGLQEDLKAIGNLVEKYHVQRVVVGLPLHMDGRLGDQGEEVVAFGKKIEECLGVAVSFWDERLSTVAAERILLEGDLSRGKRKKVIDKVAACWILEGYLQREREREKRNTCE
jgi:putative Holliday junction resolvase